MQESAELLQIRFLLWPCSVRAASVAPNPSTLVPSGKHPSGELLFCPPSADPCLLDLHPVRADWSPFPVLWVSAWLLRDISCLQHSLAGFPLPSPCSHPLSAGTVKSFYLCSLPWSCCKAAVLLCCWWGHVQMVQSGFSSRKFNFPSPHMSCQKITAAGKT